MVRIGITGGIGSGKSVVSELMKIMNIPVYNADDASKNILKTDLSVQKKLKELLGDHIFSGDELNKALMASLIFNNPDLLSKTNAIIHPAVFDDFNNWSKKQKTEMIACESAIIFESGMNRFLDHVITVFAPVKTRIERAKMRDNASEEQIISRIKNQFPDEEKVKLSDFTLVNDNRQAIIPQLRTILRQLDSSKSSVKNTQ